MAFMTIIAAKNTPKQMKLTTAHLLLWYKTFATIAGASDVHKRKKIEKLTSSGFPALPLKIIRAHIKPKKTITKDDTPQRIIDIICLGLIGFLSIISELASGLAKYF
jgi:hypothetical protein